jgi:hypothetical protein
MKELSKERINGYVVIKLLNQPEVEFKENHGVWEPMLEFTQTYPYLRGNSKVSFPSSIKYHKIQMERGGLGIGLCHWLNT